MADGHKWMLGPEGLALFYCRSNLRQELSLTQYGWHMANMENYSSQQWNIKTTAERFECGSPNMLGIHALHASISLIHQIGIDEIWQRLKSNIDYLNEQLTLIPKLTLHQDPTRASGIVNFTITDMDPEKLYRNLMSAGVVCAHRGAGIRLSPHFYTQKNTLDSAIEILKGLIEVR